jgi:hypothetical protein
MAAAAADGDWREDRAVATSGKREGRGGGQGETADGCCRDSV